METTSEAEYFAGERDSTKKTCGLRSDSFSNSSFLRRPPGSIPQEEIVNKHVFSAKIWMTVDDLYPLVLQQQVPVIELLSPFFPHLGKVRDLLTLPLPCGFPIQIEIPIHRLVSARVTFENCRTLDTDSTNIFDIPVGYRTIDQSTPLHDQTEEDALLTYALQQSLRSHTDDAMFADMTDFMENAIDIFGIQPSRNISDMHLLGSSLLTSTTWVCRTCTFLNPASSIACDICATVRCIVGYTWLCRTCTFLNASSNVATCTMCGIGD